MRSERKHDLYVNDDVKCAVAIIVIYVNDDAGKQVQQPINRFCPFYHICIVLCDIDRCLVIITH